MSNIDKVYAAIREANPVDFSSILGQLKVSENFTWAEALLSGNTQRRNAANLKVYVDLALLNDVHIAFQRFQVVREVLGEPMKVTSAYRDPETNKAVGGKPLSQHVQGTAIDFIVPGINPHQVQRRLEWWGGGLGYGASFTHLDARNAFGGKKARWNY